MTSNTTIRSVVASKAFNDGVRDIRKGKTINYDYSQDINKQWNYERGRQFALAYDGDVKEGRHINYKAILAAVNLFMHRAIL